jgi:hypothetical protein
MALMRPAARLTVDGQALSAPEAALAGLRLALELGGAHDALSAALGPLSPLGDTAAGAAVELALGYGDSTEAVFTGTVAAVDHVPGGLVLQALSTTASLSRARVAQSYLDQTVADIVQDLIGQAEVDAGQIEAPLKLSAYHVDERRPIWAYLRDLARLASCDLSCDPSGALSFRPPRGGPTADHTLRYGADLLSWSAGARDAGPPVPDVVPYGAASEEGADKWQILLREPDGGPPSAPTLVPATLRDRDGARALADGLGKAAARRATGGTLLLVGNAAVRPGDVLGIQDLPDGGPDLARALAVTHLLDGAGGFRTAVAVEGVA